MAHISSKFDQVAKNFIWDEVIRKENRTMKLSTQFTVTDPRKMTIIPDKPNYTVPSNQPTASQLEAAHDTLSALSNVKHYEQVPTEVFALPLTANMEYGFFSAGGKGAHNSPMFHHPKSSCDVVRYASSYVQLKGYNPYLTPTKASPAK